MTVIVTGGAGFIGSHVVEALLARGDEVHVVDDLSKGVRENVPAAATLHVHDVREPLDAIVRETGAEAIVHLAAQADVRVSVAEPVARRRRQRARHRERARGGPAGGRPRRLRVDRRGDLRRVRAAGARGRPLPAALAVRRREARGRGLPRGVRRGSTGRPTWRCGSATSTGRARIPTARPVSSRSSSDGCSRGGSAGSSATAPRAGTTSTSATSRARRSRRSTATWTGVLNVGTGTATSVLDLYEVCRSVAGSDADARPRGGAGRRARAERARRRARGSGARLPARDVARRPASRRPGSRCSRVALTLRRSRAPARERRCRGRLPPSRRAADPAVAHGGARRGRGRGGRAARARRRRRRADREAVDRHRRRGPPRRSRRRSVARARRPP